MEERTTRELFERYRNLFCKGIRGEVDMKEVASSYASAFIAASPQGVAVGQNDDQLKDQMQQGFDYYRQIGTKDMSIRDIRITPIDEYHCIAHVSWSATYLTKDQREVTIDFTVHYLVQAINDEPKIFGWIAGDEQQALKQHGVI